jgi:DNA-binding NarL/FixJ family response regulator
MSWNLLLVLGDAAEARTVRRALAKSRDGPFKVEWVSRCADASNRLDSRGREAIAAIVVDLSLPDSEGIKTFDTLHGASVHIPILVLSRSQDEDVARLAVRCGAHDYLLKDRLDDDSLSKAVSNMLERSSLATSRISIESRKV